VVVRRWVWFGSDEIVGVIFRDDQDRSADRDRDLI
jgi:hypothetical protein